RVVLGFLARAALHVLLAVAPGALQPGVGLLRVDRNHPLHSPARVLGVVQIGRRRALRLAQLRVALEVVRQRREADREVVAVAQAHAQRAVGGEGQIAELIAAAARSLGRFLAPQRRERVLGGIAPTRLLRILLAAAVARQLADDVVLEGAVARAQDLAALAVEIGELPLDVVDVALHLLAARYVAQRLGEQE